MSTPHPPRVGLTGLGAALPDTVRRAPSRPRDAPDTTGAVFYGNRETRVLTPGESLSALTTRAARAALADAGITPAEVDRLYGHLTPGEHVAPNELYRVHHELRLPTAMPVVPVQAEYDGFLLGIQLAREAVLCGHARHVLVAVGTALSRHTDPHQDYAPTVGDAAGATVVGASEELVILDAASDTDSSAYGLLTLRPRPDEGIHAPLFRFEPGALAAATAQAADGAPHLIGRLLDRNGITGADITLITHQNTRKLLDHWRDRIRPREHLDTYHDLGNMQFASVPVTLARHRHALTTPYLVLYAMGMAGNRTALLLRT